VKSVLELFISIFRRYPLSQSQNFLSFFLSFIRKAALRASMTLNGPYQRPSTRKQRLFRSLTSTRASYSSLSRVPLSVIWIDPLDFPQFYSRFFLFFPRVGKPTCCRFQLYPTKFPTGLFAKKIRWRRIYASFSRVVEHLVSPSLQLGHRYPPLCGTQLGGICCDCTTFFFSYEKRPWSLSPDYGVFVPHIPRNRSSIPPGHQGLYVFAMMFG